MYYLKVPLRVLVESTSSQVGRSVGSVPIFREGNCSKFRWWFLFGWLLFKLYGVRTCVRKLASGH